MPRNRDARRLLVKEVWPDKLLYGSMMLTIAGLLGLVHGLIAALTNVSFAENLAPWLGGYPVWLTIALSLTTLVCGLIAWRRLSVAWGVVGGLTGIASLSLFGIGTIHAILALVFIALAAREGEHKVPPEERLSKWDWPDKALAASLLLLMAGIAALAWGLGVLIGELSWAWENALVWGALQVAAGSLAVVAASYLYNERAPLLGVVAGVACIATFGAYFLAPGLALAGIVAIVLGWREGEFHSDAGTAGPQAETLPRRAQ